MALSTGKNPFLDDLDDEFLSTTVGSSRDKDSRFGSNFGPESGGPPPYEDDAVAGRYGRQQQMQQSMNRQLDTTQRCLANIYDSEQIGIATAEVCYQY